jgi:hypothetical protein
MKTNTIKKKVKMKFFADLSFDLNQDEVWEELSSHNEKKSENDAPIKFHIVRSLSDINGLFNKKSCMQFSLF